MSMLKVAGSDSNGNPMSLQTADNGALKVQHEWVTEEVIIANAVEIRGTDAIWTDRVDIGKYAITSLRIKNYLDQPVAIQVGLDTGNNTTLYLYNSTGGNIAFMVPVDSRDKLYTSDDYPWLQYLHNLRLRLLCSTAPTTGSITITIVGRR